MSPISAQNTHWVYIVIALYFLLRLVSGEFFESLSISIIFGLSLILALKCVGGRTWSDAVSWWKTHRVYSTFIAIASAMVGVMEILKSDRSMIQIALDVVVSAAFYWVFACAHSRFVLRWFK